MSEQAVTTLLARLERAREYPGDQERQVRTLLHRWAAFRESDEPALRRLANWANDRGYIIDNLPEKIASAYGYLLFGEDPRVRASDENDQARTDELTARLPAALAAAEEVCVSEGEVWWRLLVDPLATRPQVTWHSRCDVIPLLSGRDVVAVAFVSMLGPPDLDAGIASAEQPGRPAWRHLEIHAAGRIENRLYRGTWTKLGDTVDLAAHPDTADTLPVWQHNLPILAGRIVNRWGRRPHVGVSDYAGVWTQFLTLNEATTIGRENLRLTAKKRIVVPATAVRSPSGGGLPSANRGGDETAARPKWDATEDVLIHDPLYQEEGDNTAPFRVLEYSFDAQALIAYKQDIVETILTRCDIVPQFVGSGDFGIGASGTALRVRLLPTVNAAEGKAREWDDQLPHLLTLLQILDALPREQGGLGSPWAAPGEPPSVERTNPLPEDPGEVAARLSTLRTSDLTSIVEAVSELHPNWSQERLDEEVAAIRADAQATLPMFGARAVPPPPPGIGA